MFGGIIPVWGGSSTGTDSNVPFGVNYDNSGGWQGLFGNLVSAGSEIYKTKLQSDLLSQQIKAGQTPSIVQDKSGRPSGAIAPQVVNVSPTSLSGGLIILFVVGAFLLLILRR